MTASGVASTEVRKFPIDRIRRFRYLLGSILWIAGAGRLWVAPQRAFADEPQAWLLVLAAVLLLSWRNFIEVNPGARRVAHRVGFVFTWPWTSFDTGRIDRVEIRGVTKKSSKGSSRTAYAVSVKGEAGGLLCELEEMYPARRAAEQVARALNLPLENRLFGGRSVRKPEHLDAPLAERWRESERLKTAPVMDSASTLEVRHDGDASELTLPVAKFQRALAALVGGSLAAGIAFLMVRFELPVLVPGAFILAILYATTGAILRHSGRDSLLFRAGSVTYRRGWMLSRQRMNVSAIEEILTNDESLVLMGDHGHIEIDRPPEEHDRDLLRQFVDRQIARRQGAPVTEGEQSMR